MTIRRGEIYFVELDPVLGHEIGGNKKRPVVVLSINDINSKPLVVTVAPGTKATGRTRVYRNVVLVPPTTENGLACDTVFQCHQLRAIDHCRFPSRPTGVLHDSHLLSMGRAIMYSLGLDVELRATAKPPQP